MRYSIKPRDGFGFGFGYGFSSFAKNMSNNYSQKLLGSAEISTTDAIKTSSKRAIQKSAKATGDSIGNKIANEITNASKKSNLLRTYI